MKKKLASGRKQHSHQRVIVNMCDNIAAHLHAEAVTIQLFVFLGIIYEYSEHFVHVIRYLDVRIVHFRDFLLNLPL